MPAFPRRERPSTYWMRPSVIPTPAAPNPESPICHFGDHEQREDRPHSVVAESLPELGEEKRRQAFRVAAHSAGVAFLSLIASLELRPCFPLRNFRALRDIVADHEQQLRVFYGAREIPVRTNRVGHFVVALRNILVDPVAGVALRLADIVSAALHVDHRHPYFREFKMIRPVESAECDSRF